MLRTILLALQFKMICWDEILQDHKLWPQDKKEQTQRELDSLLRRLDNALVNKEITPDEHRNLRTDIGNCEAFLNCR